jgi:hypothetical protein
MPDKANITEQCKHRKGDESYETNYLGKNGVPTSTVSQRIEMECDFCRIMSCDGFSFQLIQSTSNVSMILISSFIGDFVNLYWISILVRTIDLNILFDFFFNFEYALEYELSYWLSSLNPSSTVYYHFSCASYCATTSTFFFELRHFFIYVMIVSKAFVCSKRSLCGADCWSGTLTQYGQPARKSGKHGRFLQWLSYLGIAEE